MTASPQLHPASIDLEAFACGESNDTVAAHVAACESCKAFTSELETASRSFANDADVDDVIARAVHVATTNAKEPGEAHVPVPVTAGVNAPAAVPAVAQVRRLDTALRVLPFLAMAAGVLLWMRLSGGMTEAHPLSAPPATTSRTSADTTGTAFKGGTQLAVIRERNGVQKRFTGEVPVRNGDRLRIEVALDHSANILGGVLAEDGTFLDLLREGERGTGTFYSEEAARFDDAPTRGYVIVGTRDAVVHARATFMQHAGAGPSGGWGEGTTTLKVLWEGP